jgi:hypothetical protein
VKANAKVDLPEGWTSESVYESRYLLLQSPSPKRYMATIDWEKRCIRLGFTTRGTTISEKKYTGRGWKGALVQDAIECLRAIP